MGVALWLTAALLYLGVISVRVRVTDDAKPGERSLDELTLSLVKDQNREHQAVLRRARWAGRAALVSAAVTALALGGAILTPPREEVVPARLQLTTAGAEHLREICGHAESDLRGEVTKASLDRQFVEMTLTRPHCAGKVMLMRVDVVAVSTSP